jgi:hypothetical protein
LEGPNIKATVRKVRRRALWGLHAIYLAISGTAVNAVSAENIAIRGTNGMAVYVASVENTAMKGIIGMGAFVSVAGNGATKVMR